MARVMKSTDLSSLAEVVDRILDKGIRDRRVGEGLTGRNRVDNHRSSCGCRFGGDVISRYAEAVGLTASAAAPA